MKKFLNTIYSRSTVLTRFFVPILSVLLMSCKQPVVAVDENGQIVKGGMRITVALSPGDWLRDIVGIRMDSVLEQAIQTAELVDFDTVETFFSRMEAAMSPNINLARYFDANMLNVNRNDDNHTVCSALAHQWNDCRDLTLQTILRRIAHLQGSNHVSEPHGIYGTTRYYFDIIKVKDAERIVRLVSTPGQFSVWITLDTLSTRQLLTEINDYFNGQLFWMIANPHNMIGWESMAKDKEKIDSLLALAATDRVYDSRWVKFLWSPVKQRGLYANVNQFVSHDIAELYAIEVSTRDGSPLLDDRCVEKAEVDNDWISLKLNAEGKREWARITGENVGRAIATVIDNKVFSAPIVMSEISNGYMGVSGFESVEEIEDMANILSSGRLAAGTKVVEVQVGK